MNSMFGKHDRSNLKSAHRWNLNSGLELQKLKRQVFGRNTATKAAFEQSNSTIANYSNMGFAYKLGDLSDRSLHNYKANRERQEKLNVELPKPVELDVPAAMEKRKDGYMMKEWDYDYTRVLVEAHGTNYKAMSRDVKRNWKQKSEGEMRKLAEQYVEFRSRGEAKLEEYTKEQEEQTKKQRVGTVLGAPAAMIEKSKTENTQTEEETTNKDDKKDTKTVKTKKNNKESKTNTKDTDNDTPNKRKRQEDEDEAEESTTKQQKPAKQTKKETTKQTENRKDAKKVTSTQSTPKAKTKATKETPKTQTTKAAPAKTETPTKSETTKNKTTKAKTEATAKQADKKQATNKSKKETPKPSAGSDDSDLEGLEFDFDGMSSDDE